MSRAVAGEGLLHPVALAAVGLLVVNDHVLKGAWGGLVTGKLSDFAGLVFFPLFLQALVEIVGPRDDRRVLLGAVAATIVVFGAVQLLPAAADAYRWGLGALQWPVHALLDGLSAPLRPVAVTPDPTDLVALPAAGVGLLLKRRL